MEVIAINVSARRYRNTKHIIFTVFPRKKLRKSVDKSIEKLYNGKKGKFM